MERKLKKNKKEHPARSRKQWLALLMSLCLIATMIPVTAMIPVAAKAETVSTTGAPQEIKTINLNAAVLRPQGGQWSTGGNLVYFGKYNNKPVAYRVLSSTTDTQESSESYLFLDCNTILLNKHFDEDVVKNEDQPDYPTQWPGSDLYIWLNGENFYNSQSIFSSIEHDAIADTKLKAQNTYTLNYSTGYKCLDYNAESHVFLLSGKEAGSLYVNNGARIKTSILYYPESPDYWWLRSTDANEYNRMIATQASACKNDGSLIVQNVCSNPLRKLGTQTFGGKKGKAPAVGVSPALNVKLSSVLFASVNSSIKSFALAPVSASTAKEWKLTLLDESKTISVTDGQSVSRQDTKVTVPYTYNGNDVTQISVMITDKEYTESDAQVLYYGKLQDVNIANKTGKGTFTMSPDLAEQICGRDYFAYIIAEDINGTMNTDYASKPVEITVPKTTSDVTVENGTLDGGSTSKTYVQGDTVTITANQAPDGKRFKGWSVVSGNPKFTDSTSTTTTFAMPSKAVRVKATYETIIDSVELTIPQLVPGEPLATAAEVSATGVSASSSNITWKKGDDTVSGTAEYNTAYTAEVTLSPDEDYVFASGVTANINLNSESVTNDVKSVTVTPQDNGTITISYTFTTPQANIISITPPQAITGVANGTTTSALGLPATVIIETEDSSVTTAAVKWDLENLEYDPSILTEQSFAVNGTVTLPEGIGNSKELSLDVTIQVTVAAAGFVGVPQTSTPVGTYAENQTVELYSTTSDAAIYYTINGSAPSRDSTPYTGAICVTGTVGESVETTIQAIAVKDGMQDSPVATFTYTIQIPAPKYPVTVTSGSGFGEYEEDQTVTITANPAPNGKHFKEWQVESGSISLESSTSATTKFTMPAEAVSVKAVYENNPYEGNSYDGDRNSSYGGYTPGTPNKLEDANTTQTEEPETPADLEYPSTPTTPEMTVPKKGTLLFDRKTNIYYKVIKSGSIRGKVQLVKTGNIKVRTVAIPDKVTIDGITYKVSSIASNALKNNKTVTKITIGNNVTSIGSSAFSNCTKLKKLTIGKSVNAIGSKAFYRCTSLTDITILSKVKKIGHNAFKSCKKLKTLKTYKKMFFTSKNVKIDKALFVKIGLSQNVMIKRL